MTRIYCIYFQLNLNFSRMTSKIHKGYSMTRNIIIIRFAYISTVVSLLFTALGLFLGLHKEHPDFIVSMTGKDALFEKEVYNIALVAIYLILAMITFISFNRYKIYRPNVDRTESIRIGRRVIFFNTILVILFTLWVYLFYYTRNHMLSGLISFINVIIVIGLILISMKSMVHQWLYLFLLMAFAFKIIINIQVLGNGVVF